MLDNLVEKKEKKSLESSIMDDPTAGKSYPAGVPLYTKHQQVIT